MLGNKLNFAKHIRFAYQNAAGMRKNSKSLNFSQEQAHIKARGSIIQNQSSPHHAVRFSHLGTVAFTNMKSLHTVQNIQLRRAANTPRFVRERSLA
ncbi:hypothetical protein TNCV_4135461 [Trichonephila clavipes]|nr:hypothetical protein TNCV_4135461 [Trichonephila clavipes]